MTLEQMEIERLRRENDELKRDNKQLGEISYILRISNIAQNALARCVMVTDIEARGIARRAQKDIKKVNEEWRKWYPVDTEALPEVETY